MDEAAARIRAALRAADTSLTIAQLSEATALHEREIDSILWNGPTQFVWQPGHRWSLKVSKSRQPAGTVAPEAIPDSKAELLASLPAKELGAITLSSGLTLRMRRRALDTDSFFSVKSHGNTVEIVFNSTHELFARLPTPFEDVPADQDSPYKELVEVLLAAWALHEDATSGTDARRSLEDARMFWGRRVLEVMHE